MTVGCHPTATAAALGIGEASSRRTPGAAGRPRPQNDTWVAACCLEYDLPLASGNVEDFEDFVEHEGLVLLGVQTSRRLSDPDRVRQPIA